VQIVVCAKQVVDTEADKRLSSDDFRIDRSVEAILNPYDEYAIEAAIQLKEQQGAEVTVLCMGPDSAEEAVRKALAMGADQAVLVSDPALAGSDTQSTAYALAQTLKTLSPDLIILGAMSTEAQTGQVPGAVAEALDLPLLANLSALEVEGGTIKARRQTDEGYIAYECPLPAVVAVAKGINEPRYPSMKGIMGAKKKPLDTRDAAGADIDTSLVGTAGARKRVVSATPVPPRAGGQKIDDYADAADAAKRLADYFAENRLP
jgi:electron transfer flavoprotein beta subunit